jgi:hypothetical protein
VVEGVVFQVRERIEVKRVEKSACSRPKGKVSSIGTRTTSRGIVDVDWVVTANGKIPQIRTRTSTGYVVSNRVHFCVIYTDVSLPVPMSSGNAGICPVKLCCGPESSHVVVNGARA